MEQPSLVYIEWVDSAAMHGWRSLDYIKEEATVAVIQSVGWIIRESEESITIVAHMHKELPQNGVTRYASDPTTIPTAMITTRRVMRKR
jgi:hypothetical protein